MWRRWAEHSLNRFFFASLMCCCVFNIDFGDGGRRYSERDRESLTTVPLYPLLLRMVVKPQKGNEPDETKESLQQSKPHWIRYGFGVNSDWMRDKKKHKTQFAFECTWKILTKTQARADKKKEINCRCGMVNIFVEGIYEDHRLLKKLSNTNFTLLERNTTTTTKTDAWARTREKERWRERESGSKCEGKQFTYPKVDRNISKLLYCSNLIERWDQLTLYARHREKSPSKWLCTCSQINLPSYRMLSLLLILIKWSKQEKKKNRKKILSIIYFFSSSLLSWPWTPTWREWKCERGKEKEGQREADTNKWQQWHGVRPIQISIHSVILANDACNMYVNRLHFPPILDTLLV